MAFAAVRHDPVASPQDGTPIKQVSDKTRLRNRCGSLWARMHRQDHETIQTGESDKSRCSERNCDLKTS